MDYRSAAIKLLPHVCARCAREFEGKRLRELTVHHTDGNHDNNPPDGSRLQHELGALDKLIAEKKKPPKGGL